MIAINLISYVLVARLVTPEDVGVFSVASAFVAMLAILRDFGSGYYIATQKSLTQEGFSTAFTFSFSLGVAIAVVLFLAAPVFGGLFNDGRVENILRLLAFNAPILAVNGCLLTVLRRKFLYGRVFWVNLLASITGSIVTLSMAYMNFGAYALACGVTANYVASALGAFIVRSPDYRLKFSIQSWREVASFGGKTSFIGGIQQLSTSTLDIAVGKYLGFQEAGLLSRAMGVVNLFNRDFAEAVRSVAIHAFSKASREEKNVHELHAVYITNYSAFAAFFFSFVFVFPREALYLLSGSQWLEAERYLRIFALVGIVSTFYQFLPLLAIATGRVDGLMKASFYAEGTRVALGVGGLIIIGGAVAYGYALLASSFLTLIVYSSFFGSGVKRKKITDFKFMLIGFVVACFSAFFSRWIVANLGGVGQSLSLAASGILAGVLAIIVFVALLVLVSHPLYLMAIRPVILKVFRVSA